MIMESIGFTIVVSIAFINPGSTVRVAVIAPVPIVCVICLFRVVTLPVTVPVVTSGFSSKLICILLLA
jgi:hypothetical protein